MTMSDSKVETHDLFAELDRLRALLRQVADGLDRVRYPGSGDTGGREWVCDLNLYLRGNAAAILWVPEQVMRDLQAWQSQEEVR